MSEVSLLILILIVLALLLQLDFVFYIVYVIGAIFLFSRWFAPRVFRQLKLERMFTDHAFLGERIRVTLRLHNRGRLPLPWLQLSESVAPELAGGSGHAFALSLAGRESRDIHYDVQATRRGYYQLGPLHIRSGDLFGWSEERAESDPSYLTIYPRIIPLTQLGLPSRLPFGTIASRQRLFEDPARPAGVRDYHSGDSLRLINWKVSAHHNNLVVKTLQPAISLETFILLNLNADEYSAQTRYSAPEWAIEIAASVAAHLVERKQAVGLASNGLDPLRQLAGRSAAGLPFDEVTGRLLLAKDSDAASSMLPPPILPRAGRAHLMNILELLARVEARRTVPFAVWASRATLHLGWGVTIPVITPHAGDQTFQALHRLVRSGYNPVLIVTTPVLHFGQIRERARQLGFTAFEIAGRADLAAWRRPHFAGLP
ncbi:MAG: DUF58 domain-containing protein [Anaerolineae bacterium]|nr:DUF58 domain-containing protein [Anaerolineae bacterium]